MEAKSILKSKTFWIAVIQAIAGVIAVFATAYPAVGDLLIAKSIIDVIVRYFTVSPIL